MMTRFERQWRAQRFAAMGLIQDRMESSLRVASVTEFDTHPTGALARGWVRDHIVMMGNTVAARMVNRVPYAAIQNRGGTITPKSGQYLAVPISPEARTPGMWPRDYPKGTFFACGHEGQGVLVHADTGDVWWALKREVYIPGNRYVKTGLRPVRPYARKAIRFALRNVFAE